MKQLLQKLFKPTSPIRLPAEIRSMGDTEDEDIFLAGYPKSGNSWCRMIVCAMLYGFDVSRIPRTVTDMLVPDEHFGPHYVRVRTPMCFKTHDLPKPRYRRVVYILRDGRDVMTSYFHYLRALHGPDGNNWEEIVLDTGGIPSSHWHEHVLKWQDNPYNAEIVTIRYEDLKHKTIPTLRRLAEFLGVCLDDDQLAQIASMTDITKLQQWEQGVGRTDRFPEDQRFFRRGETGSYRDEMPADVLAKYEEIAGEALCSAGYTISAERGGPMDGAVDSYGGGSHS